jgi:hypothetical protein
MSTTLTGNQPTPSWWPPCFALGTRIATDRGEVAVEELCVGVAVLTVSGAARPIAWIGERPVDCRRHPRPENVWPVRVCAGAFGERLPARDLRLSPDHSVFIDGVLIPIKYLVNDATIVQERVDTVHYFHVELERHDVLLAEGLPAESYLDTGNRGQFENGAAHMSLHPDFAPLTWDNACAPLCTEGSPIAAVRSRLRVRAIELSGLHVEADGRAIRPVALKGSSLFQFLLPPAARELRIVPRTGTKVGDILLDGKMVGLDSPVLADSAARLLLPDRFGRGGCTLLELVVHEVAPSQAIAA